jgi:uridine kinase
MDKPTLIIIAGPSASGKTHLIEWLYKRYHRVISVVCADNYYFKQDEIPLEDRLKQNYDHPDALDWPLIEQHLIQLSKGQPVQCPRYCFVTCTRIQPPIIIQPKPIILLDGLLALAMPKIRALADLKIYLDTPLDLCIARRIKRDVATRGRNPEQVIDQYLTKVRPMYQEFIKPSREHADIILPSSDRIEKICVLLEQYLVSYSYQDDGKVHG